jgi:hypothetical protein
MYDNACLHARCCWNWKVLGGAYRRNPHVHEFDRFEISDPSNRHAPWQLAVANSDASKVTTGNFSVGTFGTTVRPSVEMSQNLGSASNRWGAVYAGAYSITACRESIATLLQWALHRVRVGAISRSVRSYHWRIQMGAVELGSVASWGAFNFNRRQWSIAPCILGIAYSITSLFCIFKSMYHAITHTRGAVQMGDNPTRHRNSGTVFLGGKGGKSKAPRR